MTKELMQTKQERICATFFVTFIENIRILLPI